MINDVSKQAGKTSVECSKIESSSNTNDYYHGGQFGGLLTIGPFDQSQFYLGLTQEFKRS